MPSRNTTYLSQFFYTHGYFEKIHKEDGSQAAKCRMCWEKDENTVVILKTGVGSTKDLKMTRTEKKLKGKKRISKLYYMYK